MILQIIIIEVAELFTNLFACFGVFAFIMVVSFILWVLQHKYESDRWKDKWGE